MAKFPPAFQFYVADFVGGTSRLTTHEVGGYILLLCEQWAQGSVPGDNVRQLSIIMRCTPATAKSIWANVSVKFTRDEDGNWRNARLEKVRAEKAEYRRHKELAGLASAAARQQNANRTPTEQPTEPQQKPNPSISTLHSSISSTTTTRAPSLVVGPMEYAKLLEKNAHVGARLRVPNVLHAELRTKLGGENPDQRLRDWYAELDAEVEASNEPIIDIFEWLRPKFKAWAADAVFAAEMAKLIVPAPKVMR